MEETLAIHIVVNYHYVGPPIGPHPGVFTCTTEEVDSQIAYISNTYQICSVADVWADAQDGSRKPRCAITFDDALAGVANHAAPILRKYGATGTIFVITGTLDGVMPCTHAAHILLSRLPVFDLITLFNEFLAKEDGISPHLFIPYDRPLPSRRRAHRGDIAIANFKEAIASFRRETTESYVVYAFKHFGFDLHELVDQWFIGEQQLRALHREGWDVGSHTYSHRPIDNLSAEELEKECRRDHERFTQAFGESPSLFSYPYGRHTHQSVKILRDRGLSLATTIEPRAVQAGDSPLLIPRLDANDIRARIASLH
jgi:peptidoglycan/xylan/chitin deacetylase (PgdA/CDA1 family)